MKKKRINFKKLICRFLVCFMFVCFFSISEKPAGAENNNHDRATETIQKEEIVKKESSANCQNTTKCANKYLGRFTITFYCGGSCCNDEYTGTATGAPLEPGVTIAVDPDVIPLGTKVYIEGIGWRTATDVGGAIKGNHIDVLVNSHYETEELGVKHLNVYEKI